jgi:uncharacterized membrane protein YcaP (DUF421 family)
MWVLYRNPKLTVALEGSPSTLIRSGIVDEEEMKRQALTQEDLASMLNKNGFDDPSQVDHCVLQPNGTVVVKGKTPSTDQIERGELMAVLERLTGEVEALRKEIASKPTP